MSTASQQRAHESPLLPVGLLLLVLLPLLLLPLAAVFIFACSGGPMAFWNAFTTPRRSSRSVFQLLIAFATAAINAVLGNKSARDSRSTFPTRLATVSCRGSLAWIDS